MSRNDTHQTRNAILKVAEELFSEKGFNGTGINLIAEKAGVNKALIYYHFKDKDDIINSLFELIIREAEQYSTRARPERELDIREKIEQEIAFLQSKQKILKVMMMESLKGEDQHNYFFQCAEQVIKNEMEVDLSASEETASADNQRLMAHEFFTGFVPLISFVVFREKWSAYYHCDPQDLTRFFLDSFTQTHLSGKSESGPQPQKGP
jgi:AcrR family transcriptional regulator